MKPARRKDGNKKKAEDETSHDLQETDIFDMD